MIQKFNKKFDKEFNSLKAVKCEPDGHPITEDLKFFFKKYIIEIFEDLVVKIVQKDLDNGLFNSICSNETTFKNYILKLLDRLKN